MATTWDEHDTETLRRAWIVEELSGDLLYQWEAHWRWLEYVAAAEHDDEHAVTARQHMSEGQEVTALEALRAGTQLIKRLNEQRWAVMQAAREAGGSWSDIAAALDMDEDDARQWYRKAIAKRAEIDPNHDADRARRAFN